MSPSSGIGAWLARWQPPSGTIGIMALGQAGFALRGSGDLVLVDAFLSDRPDRLTPPADEPDAFTGVTAVLATHEHDDHLDLPVWPSLAWASPGATFVVAEPLVGLVAEAGVAPDRVRGVTLGAPIPIGGVEVVAVPARHAVEMDDGYSTGGPVPRFVGYVVTIEGVRIYHAGDTLRYNEQIDVVGALAPDICLLPINGRDAEREARGIVGNMTAEESAEVAAGVKARLAIPMHFETIRGNEGAPGRFVDEMRRRHPGGAVAVIGSGGFLVWPATERGPRSEPSG